LPWSHADQPLPAGVVAWVRDLNAIYRRYPALHRRDCTPGALEWISADDRDQSILAFVRWGEPTDAPVLVACNFTPVPRHGLRVGVPRAGRWREVLCSDAALYRGSGVGNLGLVVAVDEPWHGRPAAVSLTLPPLGCVYLVHEP
jgi:1,4-alpha-glucan branching enzyme